MQSNEENITQLLTDWAGGDQVAAERLLLLVEAELRRIAQKRLARERRGHTLQATALINEAYLKLIGQKNVQWQNRAHFFAMAAQFMRRILIDYARTQNRAKRGGDYQRVTLGAVAELAKEQAQDLDLILLNEALDRLEAREPLKSRIVELRFFAGLTIEETAAVLKISNDKVRDEWLMAKTWLYREINRKAKK